MLHRSVAAVAAALALPLMAAGCGGSSGGSNGAAGGSGTAPKAATAADFPASAGLTFQDARAKYKASLSLAPGVSEIRKGTTRVPFLLLDDQAHATHGAEVAIYTMAADGSHVRGPYPAREQPFDISPAYLSRTTSSDPNQEKSFYVADVRSAKAGPVAVFGLAKVGGRTVSTSPISLGVKGTVHPPDVGDKAIFMHTLTPADVEGDYTKLTTRVPPAKDLVQTDLADVLGKKPVVLMFATPALCQSRVCGPDVDVAEQVKAETKGDIAWIHQEIYNGNDVNKGLRPQVTKWRLQTEPWLFIIGRDGVIRSRVEGAISVPEMRALVQRYAK